MACATIIASGRSAPVLTAATEGAAAGATAIGAVTMGGSAVGSAMGGAVGTATATGAITGAAGGTAGSIALGTVASTSSAVGTGGLGIAGVLGGPVGLVVLGADTGSSGSGITYDCWKPVIHDESTEPSNGMLLKDVMDHPNVANISVTPGVHDALPNIVLENIWEEKFEIQYFVIRENNRIVCHAKAL